MEKYFELIKGPYLDSEISQDFPAYLKGSSYLIPEILKKKTPQNYNQWVDSYNHQKQYLQSGIFGTAVL